MLYKSTRDANVEVESSYAIATGISKDGGLYVPDSFPQISKEQIESMIDMSYPERAAFILGQYLTDFTSEELLEYATAAYDRFEGDPCPLVSIDEGLYMLELWHGPTFAFKDIALTILPHLLTSARKKNNIENKTLILVATSGDTGKAALEGFKDVLGTNIIVFYPSQGVSDLQKLQMSTQTGSNVFVAAINGNFDDAQSAVKSVFADKEINEELAKLGYQLSSANSINWGRLVPQIVYYFSAYADLVDSGEIELGEKINFTVPTGNFGNILAGYYASKMGLPINKLICASNKNNILTDFFTSGQYDISDRDFYKTISPSMDILISSNLERLLFELTDRNGEKVSSLMKSLVNDKKYSIDKTTLMKKASIFEVGCCNEEQTRATIQDIFEEYNYVMDPHTAVAMNVHNDYVIRSNDYTPTVILSTASPYKFAVDVYSAIFNSNVSDTFKAIKKIYSISAEPIPDGIASLNRKEIMFDSVFSKEEIKDIVVKYAKGEISK